jgi:FAD/FMN-containing dehydrogenase
MTNRIHREALARLAATYPDAVFLPGSDGFEAGRVAWNLAVTQEPAAVAVPGSAREAAAIVGAAAAAGLRVAAQGTGHGAAALGALDDTILLRTTRLADVAIDPSARTARVGAGVVWLDVVTAAARHGLAALAGSSPDVGVVGYTLGGGLSWLGRRHGLAANNVRAVEIVTADGRLVRADATTEPDLFWAVRGGGGSFGVVTAIEFDLFPLAEVYAGVLWWPLERASEVLQAWRELTEGDVPDELTTVGRILQLPPLPEIPEAVRGRSFVVVEVIHLGAPADAERLLAPLRALGPELSTLATLPVEALAHLHMDPEHPVPGAGDGIMLDRLSARAIDRLVAVAGAGSGSPLLSVEVRHIGGALRRTAPEHGALGSLDADYILYAVGIAPGPDAAATVSRHVEAVRLAVAPWAATQMYLNFADTPRPASTLWSAEAHARLRRIKAAVDPADVIRSNHPITSAQAHASAA